MHDSSINYINWNKLEMDRDSSLSSEHKADNALMDNHYNINRFEKAQKQRQQKAIPMDAAQTQKVKEHILLALI